MRYITLYHVTKKENLLSILRYGLKKYTDPHDILHFFSPEADRKYGCDVHGDTSDMYVKKEGELIRKGIWTVKKKGLLAKSYYGDTMLELRVPYSYIGIIDGEEYILRKNVPPKMIVRYFNLSEVEPLRI